MRLRLFRAGSMAAAMAKVRAELGPEAVILDSRRAAGGVEVTAALDRAAEPPADRATAADPRPGAPAAQPRPGTDAAEPSAWANAAEPLLIPPEPAPRPAPQPAARPGLTRHNLPPALAARLAGGALADRLAAVLSFAPLPDGLARPVLLAGPPGAGKTLSCAKLATRAVLAGGAPLVVTTDGERAGATEQLAAFTRLLGLTLAVAPQPAVLARALARRQPGQATLIDTAGCDPFDPPQAALLLGLAQAADATILVVLPAGLDPGEAAELAAAFAALGARHLLPTRLDGARRLGGVLAAAAAGLALAEAGTGPGVADGLTPIDPGWLARRLDATRPPVPEAIA